MAALIRDTRDLSYLVLTDRAVPYLLARLRWPDVAQAMTAGSCDWLEDPALFELPYDSSAVNVTVSQAASVAAGWGKKLRAEAAEGGPVLSRMFWHRSEPYRRERRSWTIRLVAGRRALAREGVSPGPGGLAERRHHARVRIDGRAHIRSGPATISVGLVDLSEGGVRLVRPDAPSALVPGATLDGPFLFEAERATSRICLDVAGRIVWRQSIGAITHFGVAFSDLAEAEAEGLQLFLVAAHT